MDDGTQDATQDATPDATEELAQGFEAQRTRLRAVAYRVLGSVHEADDAVQEAWLRLQRADVSAVENLDGWLTTVVSRICLDMLRSRSARREQLGGEPPVAADPASDWALDPAAEAERADAVGQALLIVLDTLSPAERLAFVLHDLFGVSFEEIATALRRTPTACRQLASRARRRVQGHEAELETDRARQREVVAAFLDAAKNGRFDDLVALLHPDAVVASDAAAAAMGSPASIVGIEGVAGFFNGSARAARLVSLDGWTGAVWSLRGEVKVAFSFVVEDGLVREIEFLGDPETIGAMTVARA